MPAPAGTKRVKSCIDKAACRDWQGNILFEKFNVQSWARALIESESNASAELQQAESSTNASVKGVQVHRPFVYGSYAKPIDPVHRPPTLNPDHTHQWTVYIRAVPSASGNASNDQQLSQWLKKVQFKLHETYAQSTRTIEQPPFEVTETGWGEFEVQMKLYFVPEANEKAATLWHALKLHPYGEDVEGKRERREAVVSQNYEEVLFTEPSEAFFEILTSPGIGGGSTMSAQQQQRGGKGGGGGKHVHSGSNRKQIERTVELPDLPTKDNIYSKHEEEKESARLKEARKKVETLVSDEKKKLAESERILEEIKENGKHRAPPVA